MVTATKSRRVSRKAKHAPAGISANVTDTIQRTVFGVERSAIEILHVAKTVEEARGFAAGFNLARQWENLEDSVAGVGVDMLLLAAADPGVEGIDLGDLATIAARLKQSENRVA